MLTKPIVIAVLAIKPAIGLRELSTRKPNTKRVNQTECLNRKSVSEKSKTNPCEIITGAKR